MAVFKRWKGERITSKHPKYAVARWVVYKRIPGQKAIHKSVPTAVTKADAEAAERQMVEAIHNSRFGIADTHTTFAGFVDAVYSKYVEQHNKNKGAKDLYCRILKKHFGTQLLTTITPQNCRDLQFDLQHKKNYRKRGNAKLSPSSVNRIMSTGSKIFSLACEEGILDRNPMQYVRSLPEPPPRQRLLTTEQKEALWQELQKDSLLFRLVKLAVHLPLRRGQLLAITPAAIDLANARLFVTESKGRLPRIVPLNNTAANILRAMLDEDQLPFPLKDFRKRWHPMLIRSGINKEGGTREENFHFHDLRTELANKLDRGGASPITIQKSFAHSSPQITDIYMGEDFEAMRRAFDSLDEIVQESDAVQ